MLFIIFEIMPFIKYMNFFFLLLGSANEILLQVMPENANSGVRIKRI